MLRNLSIKNYALIDHLSATFDGGLTVITGETGAGKSILLGGLSLVLGKRADLSSLRDKAHKCVIEVEFDLEKYDFKTFFAENDLDFEKRTIIRREIHPSGKSRAFINDSPVTLDILSELGGRLIDIHSQHQTLQLTDNDFQLMVIDALALNGSLLIDYSEALKVYINTLRELDENIAFQQNELKDLEYNAFLLEELENAKLRPGLQEDLQNRHEQLNNVETITELLSKGHQVLNDEQLGLLNLMSELKQVFAKLSAYGERYGNLNKRIQSTFIEFDDIAEEMRLQAEQLEANPEMLEEINQQLQLLFDLQRKHGVGDVSGLLAIKEDLAQKVMTTESLEETIAGLQKKTLEMQNGLEEKAVVLRSRRNKIIPELSKQLEDNLALLGMPNARFKIATIPSDEFKNKGKDHLSFLFSANKGTGYGELKKVASGGELSRIMLTIKAILGKYENLPTMIFDEIDSGVSGEISDRMGEIMREMGKSMQVLAITHLPQVASKGDHHFKVFKDNKAAVTNTQMKRLDPEERVVELAEMLSGKELSESAMAHARQLLD